MKTIFIQLFFFFSVFLAISCFSEEIQITSDEIQPITKDQFKKFLKKQIEDAATKPFINYQVQSRQIPTTLLGAYTILTDDGSTNHVWSLTNPILPNYLYNLGVNLFYLGMMSPSFCLPTSCGSFLSCCGTSQSRLSNPPPSFISLSSNRGSSPGQIPNSAIVLWSIGGETLGNDLNVWTWLIEGQESTLDAYAQAVANWQNYGCDGIDLDIEGNANSNLTLAQNLVTWVKMIKNYWPSVIISAPTYFGGMYGRYSQNLLSQNDLLDLVGVMSYDNPGPSALQGAVKSICGSDAQTWPCTQTSNTSLTENENCGKWNGQENCFKGVGASSVLLGTSGSQNQQAVSVAQTVSSNNLRGMMIWASVVCAEKTQSYYTNGTIYTCNAPCSTCQTSGDGINECPSTYSASACQICGSNCYGPYYEGDNLMDYQYITSTNPAENAFLNASNILFGNR